jgi:hypothetical protein
MLCNVEAIDVDVQDEYVQMYGNEFDLEMRVALICG